MRTSLVVAVIAALFAIAQPAAAQGSQSPIGGGCEGLPAPTVVGDLTIGSTMAVQDVGCGFVGSPGSFYLLGLGIPLPEVFWLPLQLQQPFSTLTCDLAILPLIVLDGRSQPIRIDIPNFPELRGRTFGMQSFCFTCGFAGCNQTLSQALGLTIG